MSIYWSFNWKECHILIFALLFTDDCDKEDGSICSNGVCLDSQCHCNDGFGGCNCQVPGEMFIKSCLFYYYYWLNLVYNI